MQDKTKFLYLDYKKNDDDKTETFNLKTGPLDETNTKYAEWMFDIKEGLTVDKLSNMIISSDCKLVDSPKKEFTNVRTLENKSSTKTS